MTDRLPSASGARLSGDDFQHAVTWLQALRLLREDGVTKIEFEVGDVQAGIADDLVVHREGSHPSRYSQVKFAVDDTTPLTHEWFSTPPTPNSKTPLERFYATFRKLSKDGGPLPELELLTNRQIAPDDPLLRHRSGRDSKLVPRVLANQKSDTNVAFEAWRDHLGISEGELAEFLAQFRIKPNQGSLEDLREQCRDRMEAVGLRGDEAAVVVGVGIVRDLVGEGTRELELNGLRELIGRYGIESGPTIATLLIQEIDHRPLAHLATAQVDWVDEFIGDTPDQRRQLIDLERWEKDLRPDLQRAVGEVRDAGHNLVRIEGAYRLPTAFAAGLELSERTGVHVAVPTRDGTWQSTEDPAAGSIRTRAISMGDEDVVAVALSISADIADDVAAEIEKNGPETGTLLVIEPESGPGRHTVAGAGDARAMAEAIVDAVRVAASDASRVNLYLACPGALAVFLGRVWNRVPSGWIFADLNPGYGYTYWIDTTSGGSAARTPPRAA